MMKMAELKKVVNEHVGNEELEWNLGTKYEAYSEVDGRLVASYNPRTGKLVLK